jgi:hypothetical protein
VSRSLWIAGVWLAHLLLCVTAGAAAESAAVAVDEVRTLFEDDLFAMAYSSHIAKDQYDEALQVAEQAIKARPENLEWRRKAANSAERAGKRDQALTHWLYLVEQGDGAARQSALRLTRSMNEFPVRRSLLEGMLLSGTTDPDLLSEYLSVSESIGATSEAYDLLLSKLTYGDREFQLKEQARLAELLGRPAEAVNALDRLALIRPLTPEETTKRAKLQFGTGDLQRDWQTSYGTRPADEQLNGSTVADDGLTTPAEPRRSYIWNEAARKTDERRYFAVATPTVGAALKYEFNQDERIVSGRKTVDSSHTVTERLDLNTQGHLYHPALMQFRLKFSPEFLQNMQSHSDISGDTATDGTTFSPNYQVGATLLSQKPYTLTGFAQHLEAQSWATYTGVTKTSTDSYGGDLVLKYNLLPTSFGYSASKSEQQGYYSTSSDWQEFHLLTRHSGVTGESSFSSSYSSNRQRTNSIANEIKTFSNTLNNQLSFTEDERVKLSSNLQYLYQDSTSLQTDSLYLNEQLVWKHLQNLQSLYQYSYRQVTSQASSNYWHSLDARLTHKLYENLTTTAGVTGVLNDADGGSQDSLSGLMNTDYQRRLGEWGVLGLIAGVSQQYTTRSGARATVQVSSESHTLNSGTETFLNQADINQNSIIVTNSAGTVVYVDEIDYRIDQIGRSLRISRLPLGSISDGQLVLISYSYTRSAGFDDLVLTQNYGVSLELLRSLSLSYRYLHAAQTVQSGPPPDRLSNSTIHLATARYDEGWGETSLTFEDARNNSDLSYTRWEASQGVRLRYGNWFQCNLRGYYGETHYRSIVDLKKTYGGSTGTSWSPYSWLKMSLEGYLERVEGDLESTINGGGRVGAEASYRLWTARLGYKYAEQNDLFNSYNRTNQMIQFEISRAVW